MQFILSPAPTLPLPFKNSLIHDTSFLTLTFSILLYARFLLCNNCVCTAGYGNVCKWHKTQHWEARSGQPHHLIGPIFFPSNNPASPLCISSSFTQCPSLTTKWLLQHRFKCVSCQVAALRCRNMFLKDTLALAGVAQWIEHRPANQRVTHAIPSQGTCLACRPGPQYRACERHHTLMFPSLSPSFPLSLKIKKYNL